LKLRVLYCDDYYGYTLESWIRDYLWLIEREVCDRVQVSSEKLPGGLCSRSEHPVYLEVDGEIVVEGLPGEEGYLIEVLKALGKCENRLEG
jgi:hypothetical protein